MAGIIILLADVLVTRHVVTVGFNLVKLFVKSLLETSSGNIFWSEAFCPAPVWNWSCNDLFCTVDNALFDLILETSGTGLIGTENI